MAFRIHRLENNRNVKGSRGESEVVEGMWTESYIWRAKTQRDCPLHLLFHSLALEQRLLHLPLHVLHLLTPLLGQALLVVADDGRIAHQGDEADAEEVREARAQTLHGAPVTLRVLQVHLQNGAAEELGLAHHAFIERVQVLVAHVVGVALLEVFLLAFGIPRLCLHHFHELAELVAQVLLDAAVLAVQGLLLDLHQSVAVLLRQLVQGAIDRAELSLQPADVLIVHVVQHHADERAGHAKDRVHHGCRRRDGGHALQYLYQTLLQLGPVLDYLLGHDGSQGRKCRRHNLMVFEKQREMFYCPRKMFSLKLHWDFWNDYKGQLWHCCFWLQPRKRSGWLNGI